VRRWIPLGILASAQFIMVLDSSVMNVSISQIVDDLDTTIQGVQGAITAYTLVMAAFMLVGARLGDILGRDRAFAIGLGVYGIGSLTTSLSPNLYVLLFGWSLVEGLGAVLVIPAIAALIAANYEGKARGLAFGVVGAASGVAVAAGPLIGGWVTTTFSWRYVFAGETVVVVFVLLLRSRMQRAPKPESPPKLDLVGAALSAVGLGLIVFGVLKSSEWGWVQPAAAPTIAGHELTPFGFSLVPFLILAGFGALWLFASWEERRERAGRDALLDRSLLKIGTLRAGLSTLLMQQLIMLGTFFVLPVYLQVVLGLDAFETGKRLFPMSVALLVAALAGPRLAGRLSPKRVAQIGLAALSLASFGLLGTVSVDLRRTAFAICLAVFGLGAGLLLSQLGNVIVSSVAPEHANEAGGLQGTAQNLGASLGTALIGAVLLAGLAQGFESRVKENPAVPQSVKTEIANSSPPIPIVPVSEVEHAATDQGLTSEQASAIAQDYSDAQIEGLKKALLAVAAIALLSFWFTRGLPAARTEPEVAAALEPAPPDASPITDA
jgi:EmrB/QacA subfamily drug resistance transporter